MTKAYSNDLRGRVIDAVEGGLSRRAASERFGVAVSTAIKWVGHWRQSGSRQPRPQGGDKRSHRIEAHGEEIFALIDETPDVTLAEIAERLERGHNLRVAQSTVWRFLERHGVTFKKNGSRRRTAKA